ncbi:MAG: hypothetical protein R3C69_05755 [Geminicoccaceae bacterium]
MCAPTTCRCGGAARPTSRSRARSTSPRSPARRPSSISATTISTGWCRRKACILARGAEASFYLDPAKLYFFGDTGALERAPSSLPLDSAA